MEYDTIDVPQAELDALTLEATLAAMNAWRERQERTATVTVQHLGISVTVKIKENSR